MQSLPRGALTWSDPVNYYPFHVGDYVAHTAHLEPMEDLAYRRMLDAYYLREAPLPTDPGEVARLVRMRKFMPEVKAVLDEFFQLTDDGWTHARCDEEILRMQDKQAKARASAAASVNARRAKASQTVIDRQASAERSLSDRSTDVELPTPTPTPTPKKKDNARPALAVRPDGVSEQVWIDFVAIRKAKRSPLTETALAGIEREAVKAGLSLAEALAMCCQRGWQGLNADWVHRAAPVAAGPPRQSQRSAFIAELTGRARKEEYVDVVATETRRIG